MGERFLAAVAVCATVLDVAGALAGAAGAVPVGIPFRFFT